ncbi:hypothetical protein BPTFM16_00348 [Altererythrobacter insulae]|nr:hypothetical protein BPTFM16_00348 [Altererythrobacter insulae]
MKIYIAMAAIAAMTSSASAQEATEPAPLTRADFVVQMDAEFKALDRDGSNVILPDEIEASQREAARNEALRQNAAVFAGLDRDGNGMLDAAEFAALANPDAIAVSAQPLMNAFDTDGDGAITLVEYRIVTQGNFDRTDTDRDGVITPLEMRAAGIEP